MSTYYPIGFISKEDVIEYYKGDPVKERIAKNMSEEDMKAIAENMSKAFYEIEFHRSLKLAFNSVCTVTCECGESYPLSAIAFRAIYPSKDETWECPKCKIFNVIKRG